MLSGNNLAQWNGLTEEYQDIFFDELLPVIEAEVAEHSVRVDAVAVMVAALADIKQQEEANSSVYTASGRVRCYLGVGLSYTSGSTLLRCKATMAKIRTKLRISQQFGPPVHHYSNSCWDCAIGLTFAIFTQPLRRDRVWIAHGWGYPTGYRNGPHPEFWKYYKSKCLPIRCRL